MLNYPLPGQPAKVQADMGSDNAQQVHKYGGSLTGNQYKVLTHMAWVSYDRRGVPKAAKDRDGNPAKPLRFFGNAQAAALEALGDDKDPYVALKAWETAVRELLKRGLLRRVQRAIPHKQTAVYELNLEALETGRKTLPETGRKTLPVSTETSREILPEMPETGRENLRHTYKLLNSQDEASNQQTPLTSRSRRAVSSPPTREPSLLAQDDDSSTYDKARLYLGNLGPDRSEHFMEQARAALGAGAPLKDRIIHAAQLAGLPDVQEREAS